MIMNNKFLRLSKETFTATFKVLSEHLPGQKDQSQANQLQGGNQTQELLNGAKAIIMHHLIL
jgi:hypothetical protein